MEGPFIIVYYKMTRQAIYPIEDCLSRLSCILETTTSTTCQAASLFLYAACSACLAHCQGVCAHIYAVCNTTNNPDHSCNCSPPSYLAGSALDSFGMSIAKRCISSACMLLSKCRNIPIHFADMLRSALQLLMISDLSEHFFCPDNDRATCTVFPFAINGAWHALGEAIHPSRCVSHKTCSQQ